MKKFIALTLTIILALSLVACGTENKPANDGNSVEIVADYNNVSDFEAALNKGEDLTDKVVIITVDKFVPDSAFGYNIQTGEHLNFCSAHNPNVKEGDVVTVKVTEVTSMLGSYIITYEMLDKDSSGAEINNSNKDEQSKLLPLEVKEFGYSMENDYVYYSVNIYNPNKDKAIEFPSIRITARNEAGDLLGTEDQTFSIIYPEQNFVYASSAFDVDEIPATVEIEALEPQDYNVLDVIELDNPEYIPLNVTSSTFRTDGIVGEFENNNNYDIDSAIVAVVFRDNDGKLIGGKSTFVDSIKANSKAPFDISIYQDFATENFEVYANIW